ncbi:MULTISPECIES: BON domain-containing protein [Cyanophyceae]|uniref:Transporter n=1 Tax=Nodularia spumigena CENA596 TaxID=1819295 RepID=A0A161VN65_NODSP|nr:MULTISPECIES: BON domain-containing protein [Cyanophyceae]MDB9356948.1 BON domain-containing protein [Nodularia spumigena CS-587/03]KZL48265.1 transporter [Nodularia spumigena CENA596]MDB9303464.1 BON domain-containing protein [Nodularia spumigena CS-591/12]MDB9318296.1 BON domain-containing protein [Nodularia spumigena CS-590/01A]MDB9323750.1 BON domain-containing protein [Nodularia spumigena CS-591/07A]
MKKLTPFLIGCVLLFGAVACDDTARTTRTAPEPGRVGEVPAPQETQAAREDAQSRIRREQLDADIRAREERNLAAGGDITDRTPEDLASEVRSKLEANIPDGVLTVEATEEGTVTVSGTVNNQDQLSKIKPLAQEINGVNDVIVNAVVAQPQG